MTSAKSNADAGSAATTAGAAPHSSTSNRIEYLQKENEELRRQAAQLEEKRRQLELEYARLASPVEIEKRAQKVGLAQPQSQPTNIRRPTNAEAKPKR